MTQRPWRRLVLLSLLALLIASPVLDVASVVHARDIRLHTRLRVAVIVFDPGHRLLGDLANRSFTETFCSRLGAEGLSVEIELSANITYLYAPDWAVKGLRDWLSKNYVEEPAPPWARSYAEEHGLVVKWVELRPFYEHLWRIVGGVLSSRHMHVDDIVAVIGDIDNVSRQYFENPPSYIKALGIKGVRGWAGEKPLVFYDLSVVPEPWPPRFIPFHGLGVPVNASTEPPVWSLRDPASYIKSLVTSHIVHHYLSFDYQLPWYSRRLWIRVYVVDYGNENLTHRILRSINTSLVKNLVESMDPFTNVTVSVGVLGPGAPAYPSLGNLLSSARLVNGWLVLNYTRVSAFMTWLARERLAPFNGTPCIEVNNTSSGTQYITCHEQCSYVFLVLATPKPSYMVYKGMNVTALSQVTPIGTVGVGLTTFPGYAYRVLRGGINRVIAHEAGHYLGLNHPFQTSSCNNSEIRWLMDFIETPMSYYDQEIAYYRPGDKSPYNSFQTALIHIAALIASGQVPQSTAQRLLDKYPPQETLQKLLYMIRESGVAASQAPGSHSAPATSSERARHEAPTPQAMSRGKHVGVAMTGLVLLVIIPITCIAIYLARHMRSTRPY